MPLVRSTLAMAAASTPSAKSMVPTTVERSPGSVTNGAATGDRSAHPYRIAALSSLRLAAQVRPPLPSSHSVCSAIRKIVASAGVLYVCSSREFSMAVTRSRKAGMYRPDSLISEARAIAAGDSRAIHRPPSEPKFFCGAK